MLRFLPFLDLKTYRATQVSADVMAALSVALLAIPQGVAYAMIAGLPPAMGLYACGIPVIVGCLLRSSRHVITGPSNALSLLVGVALVSSGTEQPIEAAITLAFMVGVFQLAAGLFRLGGMVDYISQPVVLGYVVGAGVLIAVGQLPNATGVSAPPSGLLVQRLQHWAAHLPELDSSTSLIAVATVVLIALMRQFSTRFPAGLFAVALATAVSWTLGWPEQGVRILSDVAQVPTNWVSFSVPSVAMLRDLLPFAVACTVLSSVESAAVGRSIASTSGQRLEPNTEFFGQGAANLVASFLSGYPISGSLARSTLNAKAGAQSRVAGVLSGAMVFLTLPLLAPLVNLVPVGALAGLILVVAADLIQPRQMWRVLAGPRSDGVAMVVTLIGTWVLNLDTAIYLGVGISLVLFLRRARLIQVKEMVVSEENRLQESEPGEGRRCHAIRLLHVEGNLFFGAAGELRLALEAMRLQDGVQVVVVRLKRTRGLDSTSAQVLTEVASRMREAGQRLILVGLRDPEMRWLGQSGALTLLGHENVIPTQEKWFAAMNDAIARAVESVGLHECTGCPIQHYLDEGST
jgi:SulP family sulfate permease